MDFSVVLVLACAMGLGLSAFALAVLLYGPSKGCRCPDGKGHDFGNWAASGGRQRRTCKKCGWTESAGA